MTIQHLFVFLLILPLTACSTTDTKSSSAEPAQAIAFSDHTTAWRTCYFKTTWPEGQPPRWEMDLLLAHRYLGPILAEQEQYMQSWRFHRRAARDDAGHLFRFHFYTDSNHAAQIINRIKEDPLRAQLLQSGVMQSIECMNASDISNPDIGDTSDPAWPDTIRDNWPPYIMGISRMWLGLIDDAMKKVGLPANDIDKLVEQYKQADEIVTTLWHVEGEHALLHHLNAIFGYQPIHITF